jgi:hypothetical protein
VNGLRVLGKSVLVGAVAGVAAWGLCYGFLLYHEGEVGISRADCYKPGIALFILGAAVSFIYFRFRMSSVPR